MIQEFSQCVRLVFCFKSADPSVEKAIIGKKGSSIKSRITGVWQESPATLPPSKSCNLIIMINQFGPGCRSERSAATPALLRAKDPLPLSGLGGGGWGQSWVL